MPDTGYALTSSSTDIIDMEKYLEFQFPFGALDDINRNAFLGVDVPPDDSMEFNAKQTAETLRIEKIIDSVIFLKIDVPNPSKVRKYLFSHPDIDNVCVGICTIVSKYFFPNYRLSLEVFTDHDDDYEHLALYVRQDEYEKNIMAKIRQARKYFRSLLKGIDGDLHITTDFQPPK